MTISVSFNNQNFEQVMYSREDDFERLIVQNTEIIFGEKTIYLDVKRKINTSSLGGSIPDGFLIDLSDIDDPQFYLVEVELQSHDFFRHIFPQITKFFAFYRDSRQRHKLVETIFEFFRSDPVLTQQLKQLIGTGEIYKFLKDMVDSSQNILLLIDELKPELDEIIKTYTDTWGKMVSVQVVNHFQRNGNNILTVEPPFQDIFIQDAVSSSPCKELSETTEYTENHYIEQIGNNIKNVYSKLKQEFLKAKSTLKFEPTKCYIGVVDRRRIAYIQPKRNKIHLIVLLPDHEVRDILSSGYHKVVEFVERRQRTWGGSEPSCGVDINGLDNWNEIQDLINKLVAKFDQI